jgi:hypothetical protein
MTIRTATTNDIPTLRELYLELEKDGVRYQPEHFVIGTRTDEFFQSIFDSPTQDILVADENGEYPVGYSIRMPAEFATCEDKDLKKVVVTQIYDDLDKKVDRLWKELSEATDSRMQFLEDKRSGPRCQCEQPCRDD